MEWRALAVAVVALTAGCGAFAGGTGVTESPTETLTPAPVPTASPTTEDPRVGVAPGVSSDGVFDVAYLAETHVAVARETRWAWRERLVTERRYGNVSVNTSERDRVTYVNGSTYRRDAGYYELDVGERTRYVQDYEVFANGRVEYRTWNAGAENRYRRDDAPSAGWRYASLAADPIRRYLAVENATVVRLDDGGERARYRVVGSRRAMPSYGPVENYTARAIVRSDGFVERLDVDYERTIGDEHVAVRYEFAYREIGTATVERPNWVDDARECFRDFRPLDDGTCRETREIRIETPDNETGLTLEEG